MNRRLAAAVSLSLGGHAVLLAIISFGSGFGQKPEQLIFNEQHFKSLSASVTLSLSEDAFSGGSAGSESFYSEPFTKAVPAAVSSEGTSLENSSDTSNKVVSAEPSLSEMVSPVPADVPINPGNEKKTEGLPFAETTGGGSSLMNDLVGAGETEPSLLSELDPQYPLMARRAGVEGVVNVIVTVDRYGHPVACLILPPHTHKLLEESAINAVMDARFHPGRKEGNPVQGSFRLKVRYELDVS